MTTTSTMTTTTQLITLPLAHVRGVKKSWSLYTSATVYSLVHILYLEEAEDAKSCTQYQRHHNTLGITKYPYMTTGSQRSE